MKNKRGVSPVIATVLLIAIVVIIALIIFLWFRGLIKEEGTKFNKNVKLVCPDVKFEAEYLSSTRKLNILNTEIVPIFRMKVKLIEGGSYETKDIKDIIDSGSWPPMGLNEGQPFSSTIKEDEINEKTSMILIPVLLAKSSKGEKIFTCEEERDGKEIDLS